MEFGDHRLDVGERTNGRKRRGVGRSNRPPEGGQQQRRFNDRQWDLLLIPAAGEKLV